MELNLAQTEALTGVSRYQLSRYAADGRLTRTRQGHYLAESTAGLVPPFRPDPHRLGPDLQRKAWLADQRAWFRRRLRAIVKRSAGGTITPGMAVTLKATVRAYAAALEVDNPCE